MISTNSKKKWTTTNYVNNKIKEIFQNNHIETIGIADLTIVKLKIIKLTFTRRKVINWEWVDTFLSSIVIFVVMLLRIKSAKKISS